MKLTLLMIVLVSSVYGQSVTCNNNQKAEVLKFCANHDGLSCGKKPLYCKNMNEAHSCRAKALNDCKTFHKNHPYIHRFQCNGGWDITCMQMD
ncbi:unnamed protein product [Cunninghamella echinulata]